MNFIFNELSVIFVNSYSEAEKIYNQFFNLCLNTKQYACFSEKNRILIPKNIDIKTIAIFSNFTFIQWISKIPRLDPNKAVFLKMITNSFNPIIHPEYTHNSEEAAGLGYAFANKQIVISLLTDETWNTCSISVERLSIERDELQESQISVKHLSKHEHIDCHKRIFKHHIIKHSWSHSNKDSYTSQLLYRDPMGNDYLRLQNLLNCAIPIDDGSFRLAFLDKERKKYIIFHPESKMEGTVNSNVFHAFHVDLNENKILIGNIKKKIKDIAIYGH